ncbi:forkhead box protein N3-like, partial [Pollicipes pollicipes]|uniref:forkhead box protein N3-like n=1 Tax=Pollicipes pollicipes TaxID=41117 RepID=UPI0018855296
MMLTPEVARSLGIVLPSRGAMPTRDYAAGVRSPEIKSEVDSEMIDPDQFLETELASGKPESVVDEDLTSLSWLHNKNLLKDIQLRPAPAAVSPPGELSPGPGPGHGSPTSDYLEEASEPADESPLRPAPDASRFNCRRQPHPLAYDPKVHVHFKPPFSFSCLIFMAIEDSPRKALPVKEIYGWIMEHFPFYRAAPVGWKNSVRHNLSLNKCFKKVDKVPCMGKGSLWTVEPMYRLNLIQTLKRSPCVHPWKVENDSAGKP